MSTISQMIEGAFGRLSQRPGYVDRPDQKQLALLISDLIEGESRGVFEAPTGLGKSLAALIPAIAHALEGKRTVIATYTNVLAEQYWRKDLPLAMSLFDLPPGQPRTQFLIGRQRYACLASMREQIPEHVEPFKKMAELGIETEFRQYDGIPIRQRGPTWSRIAAPPVCPGRLCKLFDDCFYYKARRKVERAEIVITNHSVVIQDALIYRSTGGEEGLLGDYDFLIIDEAHDFPQAAINGLEFELSAPKLSAISGISVRLESVLLPEAQRQGEADSWQKLCTEFRQSLETCQKGLLAYGIEVGRAGILTVAPTEIEEHPHVKAAGVPAAKAAAESLAAAAEGACESFVNAGLKRCQVWSTAGDEATKLVIESGRSYWSYIREYGENCGHVFTPRGVAVSYVGRNLNETFIRQDVVDLVEPLRELIWERAPYACLSATLALDGSFDFFKRTTGVEPDFEEVLPTPFDYSVQAALYLPKANAIPDPTVARREGSEEWYWRAVAGELSKIIRAVGGRTLALFHSRKEMEGVLASMDLPPEMPVLVQQRSGAGSVGEKFKANTHASLFALRSFWTGFDAPGETLSCVALVRVPFEVPVDPPQIARLAFLQVRGIDAFGEHTLPMAKMIMRQGAGRLVRRADDKGIVAILDPRIRTKRYGEAILANLPAQMRSFDDIDDAVGWVGITAMTAAQA